MRIITAGEGAIDLGRQGEHLAVRVRFPVASFRAAYGEGSFRLLVRRSGDGAPYPVPVEADGDYVCWDVTGGDTAMAGTGACELRCSVGETLAKSRVWATRVTAALGAEENGPPEPWRSRADAALSAGLPPGGAAGDVLAKRSGADGDAGWTALPSYAGAYEVTPLVGASTTMGTARTFLDRDVVVREVPVYTAENPEGGNTVVIGG